MQALEAETATFAGSALAVVEEASASGSKALVQAGGIAPASEAAEGAAIPFNVSAEGQYVLWARLKGASAAESAMFLGFDGSMERVDLFSFGQFVWVAATFADLIPGEHVISVGHAEPNTYLDAIVVSSRRDFTHEDLESFLLEGVMPVEEPDEEEPVPGDDTTPGEEPGEEPGEAPGEEPMTPPSAPAPIEEAAFDLRGDPSFDPGKLSGDAQVWYRRLWRSIDDPVYDPYKWAASDDLYKYARDLHTHIQFLLHAFRATGDLKILDEIDSLTEIMRDQLHDSWRDVMHGSSDPGRDGYLNWVWRYTSGDEYIGKDTNKLDEMKTHALIASVAYALELNRDLKSPGGVDYGKHADFWVDYLVNHFEAKWRKREKEPTGFPIMIRAGTHTYYSWMKWHYYMALLTGNDGYMKEAERMAGKLRADVREVSASSGTALVWPRGVVSEGSSSIYLHPTVYARYAFHDAIEFYFEDFGWWNKDNLSAMARTIAEYVIDPEHATGSRDWFTGDIGGDRSRGGIDSDGWNRMDYYRYETSAYATLAPWDSSGKIDDITDRVLDKFGGADSTRYIALPVAKLVTAVMASR